MKSNEQRDRSAGHAGHLGYTSRDMCMGARLVRCKEPTILKSMQAIAKREEAGREDT